MVGCLLDGKSTGGDAVITVSGCSNAAVFQNYLQSYFFKYVQGRDTSDTVLVM